MHAHRYRHVFGVEGKGVHAYRVFGVAAVDLLLTVLLAALVASILYHAYMRNEQDSRDSRAKPGRVIAIALFGSCFAALMATAIVLHRWFCVNTALNVALFGVCVV